MAQWKQFLDQWIAAWSRVLEQAMGTDTFAQVMGKQLEGFLNVSGAGQEGGRAADRRLARRRSACRHAPRSWRWLATWSQVEEKIDGLEDKLERSRG